MTGPARARGPGRRLLLALGWIAAWGLLGLFFGSQTLLYARYSGRHPNPADVLLVPCTEMLLWAPLSAVALWFARQRPFERRHIGRALAFHVPAALALSSVQAVATGCVFWALGLFAKAPLPVPRLLLGLMVGKLSANIVTYAAVVTGFLALDTRRRLHERELRASQLEARLADARLDVLRMQLQPHFLFNTLHAISTLMHRDVEAADRMLVRLSDLLRLSMEHDDARDIPLSREMQFLDAYVQIQQVRFGERLRVRTEIEPRALDGRVPTLLLQPLVENAIQHGISHRAAGGAIEITARVVEGCLILEIGDDGPGWNGAPRAGGRGLANTRARIEQMAPGAARFECVERPGGGALVRVTIPFVTGSGVAGGGAP